eukprot:jgi/Bigna1/89504/estExt_fgenesh1_pg.C_500083
MELNDARICAHVHNTCFEFKGRPEGRRFLVGTEWCPPDLLPMLTASGAEGVATEREKLPCRLGFALGASLVPATAAVIAGFTVAACYILTEAQDSFINKGILFPAVSFLGRSGDAKLTYQIGFATTGMLLLVTIGLLYMLLAEPLSIIGLLREDPLASRGEANSATTEGSGLIVDRRASARAVSRAFSMGLLSAAGVIVQGVFVLELKITAQTLLHWAGALMFMMGAQSHAKEVLLVYETTASEPLRRLLKTSLTWKQCCVSAPVLLFLVPIAVQIGRAASGLDSGAVVQNSMGVMQWGIIGSYILFFLSYSLDLFLVIMYFPVVEDARADQPLESKKNK